MKYYVYILMDHHGTPFYVGKGSGGRHKAHLNKSHNQFVNRKIQKLRIQGVEPRSEVVANFDDEESALDLEVFMIRHYGLRKNGGILCNLTDERDIGGIRPFAGKHTPVSKPVYHKGFIFPSRRFAGKVTKTPVTTFARMLKRKWSVYLDDPFFEECMKDYSVYEKAVQDWQRHLSKRHPNAKRISVDGVVYSARDDVPKNTNYSLWYIKQVVNDPEIKNIYYLDE